MDGVSSLRAFVHEACGICLGSDKDYLVVSRLTPIMRAMGFESFQRLSDVVRRNPAGSLASEVIAALTTNETSWFRDGRPFEFLKDNVLPELRRRKPADEPLRIWSAASSTGQEAYSIAMCLEEGSFGHAASNASILASDVSTRALEQAAAGLYSDFEIRRGLSERLLTRFFIAEGALWRVHPSIRARVAFRHLNLLQVPADIGSFDVIFCRNVMIYFDAPTRNRVIEALVRRLAPGGYLFFGSAETLSTYTQGRLTLIASAIYRKD